MPRSAKFNPIALYMGRLRAKRDARAWSNTQWAEIENRRRRGEKPGRFVLVDTELGLSGDDWMLQRKIWGDLNPPIRGELIGWWVQRNYDMLRDYGGWRRIRKFWERGRRGWARTDVWEMHAMIARTISGMAIHLRETSHGHPMGLSESEWDAILTSIAEGFDSALILMESGSELRAVDVTAHEERFHAGVALLDEWFFDLWD